MQTVVVTDNYANTYQEIRVKTNWTETREGVFLDGNNEIKVVKSVRGLRPKKVYLSHSFYGMSIMKKDDIMDRLTSVCGDICCIPHQEGDND